VDIITDSFNNISLNQLSTKISQKYSELQKIDEVEKTSGTKYQDYIESTDTKNYDEKDFARVLNKFKQTDANVRSHEQVHASIGHTTAPISYNYQEGPDGKMYVVGGSVRLDTSLPDDPKAAAFKLDQIQKSSSGAADLSGADVSISSQANLNKMLLNIQGEDYAN
jgi:hypothetical protein